MNAEQIDLVTVKLLIEQAKNYKTQLLLMDEQLSSVTQERDVLAQQMREHNAQFMREKEQLKTQQATEMLALQKATEEQLAKATTDSQNALQEKIKYYEDKMHKITKEFTEKNATLLSELQQTQKKYQAVINRIRGLSA